MIQFEELPVEKDKLFDLLVENIVELNGLQIQEYSIPNENILSSDDIKKILYSSGLSPYQLYLICEYYNFFLENRKGDEDLIFEYLQVHVIKKGLKNVKFPKYFHRFIQERLKPTYSAFLGKYGDYLDKEWDSSDYESVYTYAWEALVLMPSIFNFVEYVYDENDLKKDLGPPTIIPVQVVDRTAPQNYETRLVIPPESDDDLITTEENKDTVELVGLQDLEEREMFNTEIDGDFKSLLAGTEYNSDLYVLGLTSLQKLVILKYLEFIKNTRNNLPLLPPHLLHRIQEGNLDGLYYPDSFQAFIRNNGEAIINNTIARRINREIKLDWVADDEFVWDLLFKIDCLFNMTGRQERYVMPNRLNPITHEIIINRLKHAFLKRYRIEGQTITYREENGRLIVMLTRSDLPDIIRGDIIPRDTVTLTFRRLREKDRDKGDFVLLKVLGYKMCKLRKEQIGLYVAHVLKELFQDKVDFLREAELPEIAFDIYPKKSIEQ